MSDPAIRVTDLHTAFGSQKVLDGVSLAVAPGQTLVVLGRSGTGKSVLLRHLIGLRWPDTVEVLGRELQGLAEGPLNAVRMRMGFVFQNAALYDSLTVVENVEFPLKYHTAMTPAQRREKAMALLARVELQASASKLPTDISGGMKKRAGLARALALDPGIMLYDEPTAGLDPITSGEISGLILALQAERSMTSVVVTHDMQSAQAISNRVALLDHGRIIFDGEFEGLAACTDPVAALFLEPRHRP
jgi:phospholipid/cholesterol/gamma-HCH transport system ATP-binding protein